MVYSDEQLPGINVRTLLIYGNREVIYDIDKAAQRAKQFIPNIQIEIIREANHITALSNPEPVNEAIIRFLNKDK